MDQDIAHADALWQQQTQLQTQLAMGPQRMQALSSPQAQEFAKQFRDQGVPEAFIPSIVGRIFGIDIPSPAGMGMMMRPVMVSPQMEGSQAPPGTTIIGTNQPPKPGEYYRLEYRSLDGAMIATPIQAPTAITQGPEGQQVTNTKTGARVSGVENTGPQGAFRVQPITLGTGEKRFVSPYQQQHGGQDFGSAGINTATLPTVGEHQIQTIDPVTHQPVTAVVPFTSHKVLPGAGGGSAAPSAAPAQGGGPGTSLPRSFPKFDENQLTPAGQKDIATIDDVLNQIKLLKGKMEEKKMQNDDSKDYYPDYFKYMHGGVATPNQDLWTGLSFEGLRSAAAALRGTNSRSLPIISRALEHVPNPTLSLTHAPDSPKNMYGKLSAMEQVLTSGRQKILEDEKKSGVVPSAAPGETGSKPITVTTRSGKTITIQ